MQIDLYETTDIYEPISTIHLELGPNLWWTVGDVPVPWVYDEHPLGGEIVTGGLDSHTLMLRGRGPNHERAFLSLSNIPSHWSNKESGGWGVFLDRNEHPYDSLRFNWIRPQPPTLSRARQLLLNLLKTHAPKQEHGFGIKSTQAGWFDLTDTTHDGMLPLLGTDTRFTSCNSACGGIARRVTAQVSPGRSTLFTGGTLQLNNVEKDAPGSWIEAAPGRYPRPGDYYSSYSSSGTQKFGHVGIVVKIENGNILTFDPGQDNKDDDETKRYAAAMYKNRPYDSVRINGWIDLDIYFYGTPIPDQPEGTKRALPPK